MQKNFRTYNLAVEFYRQTRALTLPRHLQDQCQRASSSIALNLAEGAARTTRREQRRFYKIAFASLREVQAILDLADRKLELHELADKLAAHLYKLIKNTV